MWLGELELELLEWRELELKLEYADVGGDDPREDDADEDEDGDDEYAGEADEKDDEDGDDA